MTKTERKKFIAKMQAAVDTRWTLRGQPKTRCPTIKKMAAFIMEEFPDFKTEFRKTSQHKPRKVGRLLWGGRRRYEGYYLEVRDVTGNHLFSHDTTETYHHNPRVADWILGRLPKKKAPK